jgi:predicted MFS family arabinose efflux permease
MNQPDRSPSELAAHLTLTPTEKRLLYSLVGVQFFNIVDFVVMMPIGPMLSRNFGITTAQFGVLISAYTFTGALSGLLFAIVADRFERKQLLMVIYALFIASTLSCALASSYELLLLARGSAGIFGGILGGIVNTLVVDNVAPARRGQAMGRVMTAFSLSSVAGVPASLWLANNIALGWRTPFVAISILATLWGVFLYREIPRTPIPPVLPSNNDNARHKNTSPMLAALQRMQGVLLDSNHQKALLLSILMTCAAFTIIPFLTIYATKNIGFPESRLPLLYFLGGASTLLSSPRIGKWADRAGKLKVFRIMVVLSAIPALLITHAPPMVDALYLTISTLFFIMTNGRMVAGQALIASAARAPVRGTFMALYACAMSLGLGLASLLGGHTISTAADGSIVHFNWVGYIAVAAIAVAVWLAGKIEQRA